MEHQKGTNVPGLNTFDHVVVLMLENRSFDNLLGYLYEDGVPPGKKFEGLQDVKIEMPVPSEAKGFNEHKTIEPMQAKNYNQPFPDPGEVYQHVNTQLYNYIGKDNYCVKASAMKVPYNIPEFIPLGKLQMQGFVKDYINTLNALTGKKGRKFNDPDYDLYNVIMQCYKPKQIPVLTGLAKDFAVFDHWYCSVPSQTWCNRAFWHAGTSGGKVVNPTDAGNLKQVAEAMGLWLLDVWSKDTIFQRMEDHGITHAVYTEDPFSLTSLVNGPFKHDNIIRTGAKLKRFKEDIASNNLPQYAFIEPKFYGQHNDQHPSSVSGGILDIDGPTHVGPVLLGEELIYDLYSTLKNSETYRDNTLLIITYDEHGGCFDHVPPPSVIPPVKNMQGEKNFTFDRLGVRVPMVMISSFIEKNTIVNDVFDHTSFIKTMCTKWNMDGLTDRDTNACSFETVFSTNKRAWPEIASPVIQEISQNEYDKDPLNDLQRSILIGSHYLAAQRHSAKLLQLNAPSVEDILTVGDAIKHLEQIKDLLN